jgi:hypothetical protein
MSLPRWPLTAFFRKARKSAPFRVGCIRPNLTGAGVQGREQVGRAVADVIVGTLLGGAEHERQDRLGAIQGPDLRLLVDAENHGPTGWLKLQAANCAAAE